MLVTLLKQSAVEIKVTIPAGLEATVTVLLQDSDPHTISSSGIVVLRKSDDQLSLHRRRVTCTTACTDLIGQGHGKTILTQLLENGETIEEQDIHIKPGEQVVLEAVTYHLKEV